MLDEQDIEAFREVMEGKGLTDRIPAMVRCWRALNEGRISARLFARKVGSDLDTVTEVFEKNWFNRPYDL